MFELKLADFVNKKGQPQTGKYFQSDFGEQIAFMWEKMGGKLESLPTNSKQGFSFQNVKRRVPSSK